MPEHEVFEMHGAEVLEEASASLRELTFSQDQGCYAEGENVTVSIDPRWNEDDTFRVLVTCMARGHRQVSWNGLPIFLHRVTEQDTINQVAFLSARGQAVLSRMQPGQYRLSTSGLFGLGPEPTTRISEVDLSGSRSSGYAIRTRGSGGTPKGGGTDEPITISTADGRVRANLTETVGGISVEFESDDLKLENAIVQFVLLDGSSEVQLQGRTTLAPSPTNGEAATRSRERGGPAAAGSSGSPSRLRGKWESKAKPTGSYRLVFEVETGEKQPPPGADAST